MKILNFFNDVFFYCLIGGGIGTIGILLFAPNKPVNEVFWFSFLPLLIGIIFVPIFTVIDIKIQEKKQNI